MENIRAQNWVSALCVFLAFTVPASADTLRIMGAGSVAGAFTELVQFFPVAPDRVATRQFGPSGLVREKVESGVEADRMTFLADRADIVLVYCGGASDAVRNIPQLTPVGEPESFRGLLVQRAGHGSQVFTGEQIKQLPTITQRASLGGGDQPNEWSGPRLWEVLKATGLIDAGRPRALAPLALRVIGADGYTAVIALGEVAPAFADQPILIANRLNGAPLANGSLRLIVPGDAAGGRSVRDVVRIEVIE
jgi:hypothetical protein